MEYYETRQLDALRSVVRLLDGHEAAPHLQGLQPAYEVQREKLRAATERVFQLKDEQWFGSNAIEIESETGVSLRDKLREEFLIPLVRVCREAFREQPQMREALKVPHKSKPHTEVVRAASVIVQALEPHRQRLADDEGFGAEFFQQLEAVRLQLDGIAERARVARERRTSITAEIKRAIAEGFDRVNRIEGLLLARMKRDPWLRARWRNSRRIPKALGYKGNRWSRHAPPGRDGRLKPRRRS